MPMEIQEKYLHQNYLFNSNIYMPYVCDPLGSYISLLNNSVEQIAHYCSTLINYPHQHID